MSIAKNALYNMSKRYANAARNEDDLNKAEKLTAKAIIYFKQWEEECKRS